MALARLHRSKEQRLPRGAHRALAASAALVMALAGGAGSAEAQEAGDSVSPDGKGIVGGALLGGEAVMLTMGAVGVDSTWPYLAFGGLGMVGGGVAGYFAESSGAPAELSLYMLAAGMGLVIPTIVVTLNATAYKPPETSEGEPVQNEPALEPPRAEGTVQITSDARPLPARKPRRAPRAPAPVPRPAFGLVDIAPERIALGLPAPEVRPLYSRAEIFRFGLTQGQELRFPVVRGAF
jgi:hypothetical protein